MVNNYKIWKERIILHLGWMDIDYAIRKDEPTGITEASTPDEMDLYEKWERSNRLSVMLNAHKDQNIFWYSWFNRAS
jgi:hypothetical protein